MAIIDIVLFVFIGLVFVGTLIGFYIYNFK